MPPHINSPRAPSLARESRQSTSTGCRDSYNLIANPSLIGSERGDPIGDNLSDQPGTVVLIGVNFACLPDMGDFAVPMIFKSIHAQPDSQGS